MFEANDIHLDSIQLHDWLCRLSSGKFNFWQIGQCIFFCFCSRIDVAESTCLQIDHGERERALNWYNFIRTQAYTDLSQFISHRKMQLKNTIHFVAVHKNGIVITTFDWQSVAIDRLAVLLCYDSVSSGLRLNCKYYLLNRISSKQNSKWIYGCPCREDASALTCIVI